MDVLALLNSDCVVVSFHFEHCKTNLLCYQPSESQKKNCFYTYSTVMLSKVVALAKTVIMPDISATKRCLAVATAMDTTTLAMPPVATQLGFFAYF